jgi:hypothetical protein
VLWFPLRLSGVHETAVEGVAQEKEQQQLPLYRDVARWAQFYLEGSFSTKMK